MNPKTGPRFKYRVGQYLWYEHSIYGWVRGKVDRKYDNSGRPDYRVAVQRSDEVVMLITANEKFFQTGKP